MDGTAGRRWERALLVLAALFGVVAMHATIAPMHTQPMPAPAVAASASSGSIGHDVMEFLSFGSHEDAAVAPTSGMPADDPMSVPHALMHLCLAVMTAGIVLGLLAAVIAVLLGGLGTTPLPVAPVASRPSRPPIRTAVRLAQLCVLRN